MSMIEINGISFQRAYYMPVSKGRAQDSVGRYEVTDPPSCGWSSAFIIRPDETGSKKPSKRLTLFCPYTMTAYQISPLAREITQIQPQELTPQLIKKLGDIIHRNWADYVKFGFQRDYDVAALVLNRLGLPVPTHISPAAEQLEYDEDNVPNRHGKPVGEKLYRPVMKSSRRGEVALFFMEEGQKSIREAMAKFDMSRSGVLTHLHGLNKDHGLGYVLTGDVATIMLPPGCTDPFIDEAQAAEVVATTKSGKPCLPEVTELPAKGKRREVALMLLTERPLAEVAEALDCSVSSVRSHLHDLHTKHGFGYELSPDKSRGKLLVPAGWGAAPAEVDPLEDLDPLA